jgi:hypothetical protein
MGIEGLRRPVSETARAGSSSPDTLVEVHRIFRA